MVHVPIVHHIQELKEMVSHVDLILVQLFRNLALKELVLTVNLIKDKMQRQKDVKKLVVITDRKFYKMANV